MRLALKARASARIALAELQRLVREPLLLLAVLLIFVLLYIFIAFPLIRVFQVSLVTGDNPWRLYTDILSDWYMRSALTNSLLTGLLTALGSVILGFILAYAVVKVDLPFKRFFDVMAIVPIISPPFVFSLSILLLFGNNGLVTYKLFGIRNFPIYGLNGLVMAQVVTFFPIAYLSLKGVLQAIDPSMEDAARDLGATRWQVFMRTTLPLAVPGLASAALVVFIEALADFGNPLVLAGSRFPTLAVQAYLQVTGMYDLAGGAALAMTLLVPSVSAFLLQKYWVSRKQYVTVTGKPTRSSLQPVGPVGKWALFGFAGLVSLVVLSFYAVIVVGAFSRAWGFDYSLTLRNFQYVIDVGLKTITDTVTVALITTPISGILGMFIAFLVVRKKFFGRQAIEFVSLLSFALPGTVVGIGYILAFNTKPLLLTGTLTILVALFVFRYVPVGIQNGIATLKQIDPSIEEAATDLGASSGTVFRRITLPLISPALFSGLVYAFVRAMTAISAAIFLVSAKWNLMTVQILNQVDSGRLGAAAAFSLLLVGIVIVAIVIIRLVLTRVLKLRGNII